MPSAIIVVGNEILGGFILDTNSQWLSERLRLLGYVVERILTVRDFVSEIANALTSMLEGNYDVIFVCGGLGPTPDDVTYEGVASGLGVPLEENGEILERIKRKYEEYLAFGFITSYEITGGVRKMVMLPHGSIPLKNSVGTAPGLLINHKGKKIFVLPGVPQELKAIFAEEIEGSLLEKKESPFVLEITVSVGESRLFPLLVAIETQFTHVSVGSYPHLLRREVTIRLMGKKEDVEKAHMELKEKLKKAGLA
jgi:nicotinamide-nucleotide amidase